MYNVPVLCSTVYIGQTGRCINGCQGAFTPPKGLSLYTVLELGHCVSTPVGKRSEGSNGGLLFKQHRSSCMCQWHFSFIDE